MAKREKLSTIDPWLAPYSIQLQQRVDYVHHVRRRLLGDSPVDEFALGHLHFGLHFNDKQWIFREWAPNATKIFIVSEMTDWKDSSEYECHPTEHGQWEIVLPERALHHGLKFKLHIHWKGGDGYRLPSYTTYTHQDTKTHDFTAVVWHLGDDFVWHDSDFSMPDSPLLIYEAHIGMSSEKEAVATYASFIRDVLPRIVQSGYNVIQLMAIQEHPYYGSFGYHVSNYFAVSSRFGTPDDLKKLIDTAHCHGIAVILDIVHSHAVKNEAEGLSRFDGTLTQYFHEGSRGQHGQWDSRVFDYGKPDVLHFLLSNCRFWLDEYHFDGFRFDGVTSMLYTHHGMEKAFTQYDDYFSDIDNDAIAYLTLANELIHHIKPSAITIAEEMSGLPGVAGAIDDGGIGFNYRLNMGIPDTWIKYIKEVRDEDWNMSHLFHELTSHRPEERTINYAESHDQALVGDKTIMFRLAGKEMYDHMQLQDRNMEIERAIALHKMIRLMTASTNHGGYLNFMGNEFGHPEWIDFPREGNDWSYKYARRQWHLADDPSLKYKWLNDFDREIIRVLSDVSDDIERVQISDDDHVISFMRSGLLFVFNFHPSKSFENYKIPARPGVYSVVLSSDSTRYGGQNRINTMLTYPANEHISLYLPARTAMAMKLTKL